MKGDKRVGENKRKDIDRERRRESKRVREGRGAMEITRRKPVQ